MRLVINKPDGVVGVNGVFMQVDLSLLPENIRIVQWYDSYGHVELYDSTNRDIDSVFEFNEIYNKAQLLIDTEIELKNAQEKEVIEQAISRQEYLSQVAILENCNAERGYEFISNLITGVSFEGLTLGVRVRQSDNKTIGIDVLNAVKLGDESGAKTLFSIRKLFKFCRESKVPFMTDVQPSVIPIDRYTDFLKSLGASIYKFENKEIYYAQFLA